MKDRNAEYSRFLSATIAAKLALRTKAVVEWADKTDLSINEKVDILRQIGPNPTCELGSKILCAVVNDVPYQQIQF